MALRAREHRGAIVVCRCAGACASDTCAPPSPSVRRCAAPGASAPRREGCCAGAVRLLRTRPERAQLLAHQGDRTRAGAEAPVLASSRPRRAALAPRAPGSIAWARTTRVTRALVNSNVLLALAGRDHVERSLADRSLAAESRRDRRWPGPVSPRREPLRPLHRPGARPTACRPGACLERFRRAHKNPHDERCPAASASAMPRGRSRSSMARERSARSTWRRGARRTGPRGHRCAAVSASAVPCAARGDLVAVRGGPQRVLLSD